MNKEVMHDLGHIYNSLGSIESIKTNFIGYFNNNHQEYLIQHGIVIQDFSFLVMVLITYRLDGDLREENITDFINYFFTEEKNRIFKINQIIR